MRERELTDEQWAALAAHLPAQRAATGRPAKEHRLMVEAMVWRKRVYTLCHGPYRSGRSRQGAPVRSFHRMALTIGRCALFGFPVFGFSGGSSGAKRSHSASVSSWRRTVILTCTQPDPP